MTYDDFTRRLRAIGAGKLDRAMRAEMGATVADAESRAKARLSGGVLQPRSGNLRRSIASGVDAPRDGHVGGYLRAGGGSRDVRYAKSHEQKGVEGTTVTLRPTRGRFLAIPTARVPGGNTPRWPRSFDFLRFQPIRGGRMGLLVRDVGGRRQRSEVWFILVPRVTIPARPFLKPSMREATAGIETRMHVAFRRALDLG